MPLHDYLCGKGHVFERHVKLADLSAAQCCDCGEGATRLPCAPRVLSDSIEPCRGADGKMHDSRASLERSYTPSGNPQGERYHVLGKDETAPTAPKTFDRKKRRDDIRAAISDVKNGRVAPIPAGPPA